MNCLLPYRYAILVLILDTRLVFIVKDFGKALLKTKSSPIFFSYKLSERKPLFEIAQCIHFPFYKIIAQYIKAVIYLYIDHIQ